MRTKIYKVHRTVPDMAILKKEERERGRKEGTDRWMDRH